MVNILLLETLNAGSLHSVTDETVNSSFKPIISDGILHQLKPAKHV